MEKLRGLPEAAQKAAAAGMVPHLHHVDPCPGL